MTRIYIPPAGVDASGAAGLFGLSLCASTGTTGLVADRLGRDAVLIEINPDYADMVAARITDAGAERPEVA